VYPPQPILQASRLLLVFERWRRHPFFALDRWAAFHMNARLEINNNLDRLDRLSPWAFTGSLYLARWVIILPLGYALRLLGGSNGNIASNASPILLFFGWIILSPLLETVIECAIPYWLMLKARGMPAGKRPWGFVAVSAAVMALLHLDAWPSAILPSLVTGVFLAYTYGRFAVRGPRSAVLHTCLFHAAINIVGWLMVVVF
jgi:hypothetical protein